MTLTSPLLLTLSIVSHGDADKVSRLLDSIREHEPQAGKFQVILTDNLKDDVPDLAPASWGSFHLIRNERQAGFAENHNRAFTLARGQYFAVLNPDLCFTQPVFEKLLASLQAQQADLIAPNIVDANGLAQDAHRSLPTPFELIRRRLPGYTFKALSPDEDGFIHPDWIAGMFWLMPSDVFRQMGGMDEKFFLYFEDVDFCTRLRLRGRKILVDAKAQVRHDAQRSSRRQLKYLLLHLRSAARFFSSSVYRRALSQRR